VAGFGPDVAAFAAATSIGRSREAPTATTMANPSATTIAHAPTFRKRSRSKSRAISRSRTSEPRYRPRRRIAPAMRRLEMTSARLRIPGLSVGVLPSSLRSMSTKVSTHPLSPCSEDDLRCHARETPGPRDARCIIYCQGVSLYVLDGET
jgi:hypothetical protein